MIEKDKKKVCRFCESDRVKLIYQNKFHKFKKDHGPIDFYKCLNCNSGFTFPLPSSSELKALYTSFDGGMVPETRAIRTNNPLDKWYHQCVDRAINNHQKFYTENDVFNWIDVGAGGGEVTKIMANRFPNAKGYAIDFHARPELLSDFKNVTWIQCDLNDKEFFKQLPMLNFQMVLSVTVLEHILFPFDFVANILKLLDQEGSLYLTVPDIGSIAAKAMGGFWPYFIFGEHLNIPSKRGMRLLLNRLQVECGFSAQKNLRVKPVILPYPITYYFDHFRLKKLSLLFSKKSTIGVNTGIMEAAIF